MPIRGLRVHKQTQNMAFIFYFDQTEADFVAPYYQYNVKPDFIHHPECFFDGKISLSMVKWV